MIFVQSVGGKRLRKEALQVKVKKLSIDQLNSMNINNLKKFIESLKFSGLKKQIIEKIKKPSFGAPFLFYKISVWII